MLALKDPTLCKHLGVQHHSECSLESSVSGQEGLFLLCDFTFHPLLTDFTEPPLLQNVGVLTVSFLIMTAIQMLLHFFFHICVKSMLFIIVFLSMDFCTNIHSFNWEVLTLSYITCHN